MIDIRIILNEFVKECSERLELEGIIQFGSSTYSNNFKDVDLILVSSRDIFPTTDISNLIRIIKDLENKYEEVAFDFAGFARKRKSNSSITSIFIGKKELDVIHNPNDLFLFKSIQGDSRKKILFGNDVFDKRNFSLDNNQLFEMLVVELKWALRKCLDDMEYRNDSIYHLFKTFLRVMLVAKGNFKKEELLEKFKENFGKEIKLPKNSEKIIKKEIQEEDFEDILKFTEECLRWLLR